jgi:hypothetical protein
MVNDQEVQAVMRLSDISEEWNKDSKRWRGAVLTGLHAHWCIDWDGLPIDETSIEYPCVCFSDNPIRT